jgi:hypothetical protein
MCAPLPWSQRLGYLLERVGTDTLAEPLLAAAHRARDFVRLRAYAPAAGVSRDACWRLWVNEEVEVDLRFPSRIWRLAGESLVQLVRKRWLFFLQNQLGEIDVSN